MEVADDFQQRYQGYTIGKDHLFNKLDIYMQKNEIVPYIIPYTDINS